VERTDQTAKALARYRSSIARNLSMTRKIQRYGYVPDLMDMRDHAYVASGNPLPKSVDLRAKMPPVWDQGQLGSCTAFGISAIVAFLHGFVGSQLWLYYRERVMEHTTRTDSGAQIRDGLKVVANQGLPREAEWPYDIAKFKKVPPAKVTKAAAKECLITEYKRLASVSDYLDCLASGFPFTICISVYESFESDTV